MALRLVSRKLGSRFFSILSSSSQLHSHATSFGFKEVKEEDKKSNDYGEDKSLVWVEGDAEALSSQDQLMDGYTIAFGIRNVTHIEKVFSEAYRYDYYSFSITPALGELVAGYRESYQYLVESIRRFPPQKFASMMAEAGFQKVEHENLVGGVVAIHSGLKI